MIYKFIGENKSMGLKKGGYYNIDIHYHSKNRIEAYIEKDGLTIIPYNSTEAFNNNWENYYAEILNKKLKNNKLNIDLGNTRGLTRNLDNLGRVVIPKEFRDELNICQKDKVEIFLLKNGIYITKK